VQIAAQVVSEVAQAGIAAGRDALKTALRRFPRP